MKQSNSEIISNIHNKNVISIISSILNSFNIESNVSTNKIVSNELSKNYKNVVFFIFDGLGYYNLLELLEGDSILIENLRDKLSTVFPPTTAAATTSLHTCSFPEEHGWMGWSVYFEGDDKEIELFHNQDKYKREIIAEPFYGGKYLRNNNVYKKMDELGIENHTFYPYFIKNKQCGKNTHKYTELDDLYNKIVEISENDRKKYMAVYNPFPDGVMHRQGVDSQETIDSINKIENFINELSDNLTDSLIIITADHGLIKTKTVYIDEYPELINCMKRELSNDARFPNFFIKDEYMDEFPQLFNKYFSNDFILLSKLEFIELKLFGPNQENYYADMFLGDYVGLGISNIKIHHKIPEIQNTQFKADHSGFTEKELSVPLIMIPCK